MDASIYLHVIIDRFRFLIVWGALLDRHEPGDAELLACLLTSVAPLAQPAALKLLFSFCRHALVDDFAVLAHHQILLGHPPRGVHLGPIPDLSF